MADRHTKEQRSFNMSQVRNKLTRPEVALFDALDERGLDYEKHYAIKGKPDAVILQVRLAVFVDGEFWHGRFYKQDHKKWPPFWNEKIKGNIKRDQITRAYLKSEGWHVLRLWDKYILKDPKRAAKRVEGWATRLSAKNEFVN